MRATTLTSMAVLALLWQPHLCAAQGKPADAALQTPASNAGPTKAKKSASRLGSLSPDEARRAARAHARAAAALKKSEPTRAVAAAPATNANPSKTAPQTRATEQAATTEATKPVEAAKTVDTTKTTATAKTTTTAKTTAPETATKAPEQAQTTEQAKAPDAAAASKSSAPADQVAAKPATGDETTTTGRSATVDANAADVRSTKRAMKTAERDRKRKMSRREARRRTHEHFADDQDQVGTRYVRVYPAYGERVVVVAPQAQWRYVEGPAYPAYPQPFVGY